MSSMCINKSFVGNNGNMNINNFSNLKLIWLLSFAFLFFSFGVEAQMNLRDYLWTPLSNEQLIITATPLTDNVLSSTVSIAPINTGLNSKITDVYCGDNDWDYMKRNFKRFWLMYANKGESHGVNWTIKLNNGVVLGPTSASSSGGAADYDVIALSEQKIDFTGNEGCLPIGTVFNPVIYVGQQVSGSLVLESTALYPGNYNIIIPMKWGLEEAKYSFGGSFDEPNMRTVGLINRIGASLTSGGIPVDAKVQVSITSKCNFDQHEIAIEHGQLSLDSSKDFYDAEASATLTCDSGGGAPSISLELIGKDPVIGQTANFTQCGAGSCELTYDIDTLKDKFNEKITLSGTHQIIFRSKYRPGKHPVAGLFEGNAVLKLTVN